MDLVSRVGIWVLLVGCILSFGSLATFVNAALSDPGIIPRNPPIDSDGTLY